MLEINGFPKICLKEKKYFGNKKKPTSKHLLYIK